MSRNQKHPPRRGKTYFQRSQERRDAEHHIVQMWTAQLVLDVMAGVLHTRYGFGKDRLTQVGEAFNAVFPEYCKAIQRDQEADYIRDRIDRQQQQIFGPDFLPWAERYEYWEEQ